MVQFSGYYDGGESRGRRNLYGMYGRGVPDTSVAAISSGLTLEVAGGQVTIDAVTVGESVGGHVCGGPPAPPYYAPISGGGGGTVVSILLGGATGTNITGQTIYVVVGQLRQPLRG